MKIRNIICSVLLFIVSIGGLIGLSSCNEKSQEITIYTRDTTSGTRDGFFTGLGLSNAKEDTS